MLFYGSAHEPHVAVKFEGRPTCMICFKVFDDPIHDVELSSDDQSGMMID